MNCREMPGTGFMEQDLRHSKLSIPVSARLPNLRRKAKKEDHLRPPPQGFCRSRPHALLRGFFAPPDVLHFRAKAVIDPLHLLLEECDAHGTQRDVDAQLRHEPVSPHEVALHLGRSNRCFPHRSKGLLELPPAVPAVR
eukprot:scaffold8178_cov296-Pinguiococcus_pyrenoidosus.AAC.14